MCMSNFIAYLWKNNIYLRIQLFNKVRLTSFFTVALIKHLIKFINEQFENSYALPCAYAWMM